MKKKESFDLSLRLTKIALLSSGIKISQKKFRKPIENFFNHYLYYINLSWLYMDVCGEVNWLIEGILGGKNFIELSLTAPCITISMLATSKSIFLYLNRDIVIKIVNKLKDIHPEFDDDDFDVKPTEMQTKDDIFAKANDNNNDFEANFNGIASEVTFAQSIRESMKAEATKDVEKEILKESIQSLKFVVLLLYYICAVVVCAFPLMPVSSMAYDYYTTGATECKYPYLVKYFFDAYTPQMWPAVYLHHVGSSKFFFTVELRHWLTFA